MILMIAEAIKIVMGVSSSELGTMYYPEFSPQSQWDLHEVNEERVS
jgi:hypothetical protein